MKCPYCNHEPREEQPKFCSECGKSLCTPAPRTVIQEDGNENPTSLIDTELEPGKELIANETKTAESGEQVMVADEPQSLKVTSPPSKRRKKRNRKKKKRKGTNVDFESVTSSISLPSSLDCNNDDENECKSIEDSSVGENSPSSSPVPKDSSAAILPTEFGNGNSVPQGLYLVPNEKTPIQPTKELQGLEETRQHEDAIVSKVECAENKGRNQEQKPKYEKLFGNLVQSDKHETANQVISGSTIIFNESKQRESQDKQNQNHLSAKEKLESETSSTSNVEDDATKNKQDSGNKEIIIENVGEEKANLSSGSEANLPNESDISSDRNKDNSNYKTKENQNDQDRGQKTSNEVTNVGTDSQLQNELENKNDIEINTDENNKNSTNTNTSNLASGKKIKNQKPKQDNNKATVNEPKTEPQDKNEKKTGQSSKDNPSNSSGNLTHENNKMEGEKNRKNESKKQQQNEDSNKNLESEMETLRKRKENQQDGDGKKASNKKVADNANNQEQVVRKLDPANQITVYFHVIVSKDFGVKEDQVVVKAGEIDGYKEWNNVCSMHCIEEVKDLGFLYEGHTYISKKNLDRHIPYKYVVLRKGGKDDYEFIYNVDAQGKPINRCLYIQSKHAIGREWHQYDDVCMKESRGYFDKMKKMWNNRFSYFTKSKTSAGEVMLKSIFSILETCDDINLTSFFNQLHQFYVVSTEPLLLGDKLIQKFTPGFGVSEVRSLILTFLNNIYGPFVNKRQLEKKDIQNKLIAGLICMKVVCTYSIPIDKEHLANICCVLCLDEMPKEKLMDELQKAKNMFFKFSEMHTHLTQLCQNCIDQNVDHWVWVLPVLHTFSTVSNAENSLVISKFNQEDVWAGLEGLEYDKLKRSDSDLLTKMIRKKYLLQADSILIQSWLCLISIDQMAKFLVELPIKIVGALKACCFKFDEVKSYQKQKVEDILKKLLQIMEEKGKPNAESLEMCCEASLALHNSICCNTLLKTQSELPALSAAIILTLIRLAGISHESTGEMPESETQPLVRVLQKALMITTKWLEDVYGHKFNFFYYTKPTFHDELLAWNQILNAGENVTQEWKHTLLLIILRKIKQEEPINQISIYCKEQHQFQDLHPSISKCFEDCAIEAVHLACQSNSNILSELSSYNIGHFGRLVSSIIENSWPRDDQGNHEEDSYKILQHLLQWKDATYIFKLYGTDSRIISGFGVDILELVAISDSVFLDAKRSVIDGSVRFEQMECVLENKKQFLAICNLKIEKKENISLSEINKVLTWRENELSTLKQEREWVDSLLKMFQRIEQHVKVNDHELHMKHSEKFGPQKLNDILSVKTPDSPQDLLGSELSYYNLNPALIHMAKALNTLIGSHVFITCWEEQARVLAESSRDQSDDESEDEGDFKLTVEEIKDQLYIPCCKECETICNALKSEKVTFEVLDRFFKDFKNKYEKLHDEFKILCRFWNMDVGTPKWIPERVKQIEQYHQLNVTFQSAKSISKVKSVLKLSGNFQALEILLQFGHDKDYKQKPLSCISDEVMKTKKLLSEIKEDQIECLEEIALRKDFIFWVKEALEDVNELKVFVDLASISAGENDMDVDRVACFHDAVLGYSSLLYELKPESGFVNLMQCLKKLWKALKSDRNLPKKLRDSARHIEWLKTVKESHGSVELSSLSLATAINKKGIYVIQAPKDNNKVTPDNVLQLSILEDEDGSKDERFYTLEELKELLNKLMLMSGKGEQGNLEVDKFSEIFSNVQRLAKTFIDLYLAGNMLFRTWKAVIYSSDNAKACIHMNFHVDGIGELEGKGPLTNLLPDVCKVLENLLEQWLDFMNMKRSQLYYLNYYTAEQLVYLCQQFESRDMSDEALLMLSFIKPECAKIDTIKSCFSKIGSSKIPTRKRPDKMEFALKFQSCTNVLEKLEIMWKFAMEYISSLFPGCLDIDALGARLTALAEINKKPVTRDLHPSLQPGRPNLVLCPSPEILSCALAVYMHSFNQPLPSYDEVLLCTPQTTFEEVALFFRRCLTPGNPGKKIYSLIYADELSYDTGYKSEQLFQQLQTRCIEEYYLVIICNSDREHCYIPSVFSQYKVHMIPQKPMVEIQRYLQTHFAVCSEVDSAGRVFKNGMSAGIVSSKRAGVGKSLYVKRLYQKLVSKFPSKKPVLKIIRLIKPEVDENKVLETLLPFLDGKLKSCPVIFHIDITSSVNSGISEFLFKLLVLQYLMNSEGRIWKRLPSHLYIIEILESSNTMFRKQFKPVPQVVQNRLIDLFPKILCCSPKEILTKNTEDDVEGGCGDPGMDVGEFRSECFQRPYQYLIRFDQRQNLDTFVYTKSHVEEDPMRCLQIFLLYCGIFDPSWSELRNFAWFLNLQLKDYENSVFCNFEHVGDTLPGFKQFVVSFMILMAKDFATPSLHIADQSPGRQVINLDGVQEQDLAPFLMRKKWESEPHPYIFFNDDHISMTFIGFHLRPNNVGGVDAINPRDNRVIRENIMSMQLYEGLILQRVPFNIDFDKLPRDEKISKLCMVLGIQWPFDPDETYELTMDNILKILAIKMRFRCGIPVVIMGETGCGKTRLIKFLCHLCKGFVETENMKLVKVHGGTTAEMIYQKILEAQEIACFNKENGCDTVLFFDEANTTDAISSIKEALCDHTVEGVPLKENSGLQIIAACNPYRKHTEKMIKRLESAGLGYRVKADETKERLGSIPLRQLVYRVHALPPSMMPLVWDFGQLNNDTEKKYIQQIVQRLAKEIPLSTSDIQLLTQVLSASQSYMRKKKDECSFVSLRDVERCIEVFKWFYKHHTKLLQHQKDMLQRREKSFSPKDKVAWSLVLAVGVCYHASLETKEPYRREICKILPHPYKEHYSVLREITDIQDLFLAGVQLRETIARNLALKENLFMMVICTELKIPLFLVGKPGSSKSLAKTIVADAMQGQSAHTELYKDLKQIHLVSFQCSPHSTPEGIIGTFKHCARFQEGKNLNEYVSVVVLDEIGLAEDSPKMPLKALHPLLEDGCIDDDISPHKKVGFIGISNWALDPAKMNRGIFVSRGDPNKYELIESAKGICSSDNLVLGKVTANFHHFANAYHEVCVTQKRQKKEFFGLRDFYSLIKMVFAFTKLSQEKLTVRDIAWSVLRNFSGKDEIKALDIFMGEDKKNLPEINTIDLVMENIKSDSDDCECRYLLILTKNYAALQILQQAFIKENQQPEIIFGSSFPKDQEYTQICRNINRVKICMETGQMVILLNLQNLYESLYDALNQYYVYLAGQKYVDLGLGTHRVKCRVHPKFRLIVIEEKEVVYKDFPIPLINRLEKHYLDINTFLKKEHKVVVQELENWVNSVSQPNINNLMGTNQKYSPSDVFIGYHSDTCASIVLQVAENMKQTQPDTETKAQLKNNAQYVLLDCATPDSVIRLGWKDLIDQYFKIQNHGSFLDFLCCHVTSRYDNRTVFTEITTFSRLLTSADKKILEAELQKQVNCIEILSLQQFDTEFSFLKKIRSFLECSSGNVILIIQTDFEEGSQGANLVASAKYAAVNEINKVNLEKMSVFVYFITKLPRMQGGTSYVGFRGGLWKSVHIDDLRKSKDMVTDITGLQKLTISQLFYSDESEIKESTKDHENQNAEMEIEIGSVHNENEIMEIDTEVNDKMEIEAEINENCEMETNVSLPRSEEMLDTTILIRSCVQNAIGLLRDDEHVDSRSTRRIDILINLLSTKDQIKASFLKTLKLRLHGMLKTQEVDSYIGNDWVLREAANQNALQEAGTFRQTLWRRIQTAVTPFLSQILSIIDRNANLELLVNPNVDDFIKSLWMFIFQDEKLLPIYYNHSSQTETTILVKNYMKISGFSQTYLPFSWRIKEYLEEIWTQTCYIKSADGSDMKFVSIFSQTPLGKFISSQEEADQHTLFLNYKTDFLLMTMSMSSPEELLVMEFALSTCIEELRASRGANELLTLPFVHIGYNTFQHRLQTLSRILVTNPSVLNSLIQKTESVKRDEMALDVFAAIACLETLKVSVQALDPQTWIRQVKNIQMSIELICSEGYLQSYSFWCQHGIQQIRSDWNCVFSMTLFMEHLLVDEYVRDFDMQRIIRDQTLFLGKCLEDFADLKSHQPFIAVVDVLHRCRNEVAESVSRYGMPTCAICQGDPNEPICLECNHVFCQSCLRQWLDTGYMICPLCKAQIPESFTMVVSTEIRDSIEKNVHFRKLCNGFFVDIICTMCFKDNTPPEKKVIHHLLSFLFGNIGTRCSTRSLSPFEDAVDKTPVIRSVILKLLLKYSFDIIMDYAQEYLTTVEDKNLLTLEDTTEVYLLFVNCLEDSLFEKEQNVQRDSSRKNQYLEDEGSFLQEYLQNSKQQRHNEKSVLFLQDVGRVRLALDKAAEILSVKSGAINEKYLTCVKNLCAQSGNDWYRVYLIRKLANLDGIDTVQRHFKDPGLGWIFPQNMLQKKDTQASQIDQFLVCGNSYKVLRDGVGRALIECKEERIATAIEECKSSDRELAVYMLLAVFREITVCNTDQGAVPEQESVKTCIKKAKFLQERSTNAFVQTLLNNNRPFLRCAAGMTSSHVTVFGLATHLAAILLTGNNHLLAPLKNLACSAARMQNSYLPTMPEDMLLHARTLIAGVRWYRCPNGHYCAVGECGQPMETSRCIDCNVVIGGQNHIPEQGFQMAQEENVDRTPTGHVLGAPERQGSTVAPDRDIAAPVFILLRLITHLSMLLGSEEDIQNLAQIVKPQVQDVRSFLFHHIEKDLDYLKNTLGKSADDTTTVVHLVFCQMMTPQQPGQWPVNFDDTWSGKEMRNNWEKHFASIVITPVLKNLDKELMTVNNYISKDKRISSNPIVKIVYGDPLISGEKMDLPKDSHVHCSKIWSCRERISIEYLLHVVQQKDGKDIVPLLWKFLEKESEIQMVKFLPGILNLQKELVKRFQNCSNIDLKTINDYIQSINSDGARCIFTKYIEQFMMAWNHLRLSLQTNGEIKLPDNMCYETLTMESELAYLLPRRQGLGLCATALTSYLIALHNDFIYALQKYTNNEQKYSIRASEVMDLHVISYEMEKDLVPIILSNCQYSLECGRETLQEFDLPKIQHQITSHFFQGKPLITIVGLPTLTFSYDRNYENLFVDVKKKLPQDSLPNSAIDFISKDLNAFSDVCEALNIVEISLGFLATSGGDPELLLAKYIEEVLQMGEQSSAHILEALKRCHLKNTIALWQLLTALKSAHLVRLKRDPFPDVDKAYKAALDKDSPHLLNVFLEQHGTNLFFLELHEMITLKLRKQQSVNDFPPSWILRDVLGPLLDGKEVSFPQMDSEFPEQIALAHCIEAWKLAACKKWNSL
ncbi:E3 ubiquitin-protein ligase RNF213 [Mixophyes fleayi]|uniref:E3 ubiquitin-protein ligase RNF213 n=1 Tax=Mixophyes fleayi TaxID=3061075 RepID=UPI003F4E4462